MKRLTTAQVMEALGCCAATARRIREAPGRLKMGQVALVAQYLHLAPRELLEQFLRSDV